MAKQSRNPNDTQLKATVTWLLARPKTTICWGPSDTSNRGIKVLACELICRGSGTTRPLADLMLTYVAQGLIHEANTARVVPLINKGPRAGYKNSQTWNSSLQGEIQSEIAENELKGRPPWKPDLLHKKGLEKGFNDTDLALDLWSFFTRWNAPDLNGIIWIMDFNFVLLVLGYLQRRTQRRCSYIQNIVKVLKEDFVALRLWTL